MADNQTRYPFKVIRGSLTRKELVEGKRQHVHYSPKKMDDLGAKDEVMLTEHEAEKFGLSRLRRLTKSTVETPPTVTPNFAAASDEDGVDINVDDKTPVDIAAELITEGIETAGRAAVSDWRQKVVASKLLSKVPSKKDDILEALRSLLD
jgi:hypothetical protein